MKNLSCFKPNGYALFLLFGLLKSFSVLGGYDGETLLNNEYNEHEFLAACRTGNFEAVHYFLDQEDFDPNEQLISGVTKTPVSGPFMAAQNGHHKVVEMLVAAEVDLNWAWNNGATALFMAAQNGHHKVVEILVTAEVDLNLARDDGATALFIAAQNGHHKVVEILVASGVDINQTWGGAASLFVAAQNGHYKVVEILITTEVDLNLERKDGVTALFQAAQNGHHKVVKILVENGANPFLKWKHDFIFSQTPKEQAKYIRPTKLGNLCSDMAKWQRYSIVIEELKRAEKEWKEMHPPEKKTLFFRRKKRNDPVSAVGESNLTEQTPLIGAFKRLSLGKDQ